MPDISMCLKGCDKQEKCYRWTANPSNYQAYADFKPDENGECEHFWDKAKHLQQ